MLCALIVLQTYERFLIVRISGFEHWYALTTLLHGDGSLEVVGVLSFVEI